jgi:preprotein translocase subunit SecE
MPRRRVPFSDEEASVAKTSPLEFMRQVRAETAKIVWPSRRETVMTGVMVFIMATLLGVFFLGVDSFFDLVVRSLLRLAQ